MKEKIKYLEKEKLIYVDNGTYEITSKGTIRLCLQTPYKPSKYFKQHYNPKYAKYVHLDKKNYNKINDL